MKVIKRGLFLLGFLLLSNLVFAVELVNINTADAATLSKELNGIGPSKAQAIIEYRDKNGPFMSIDALSNVKGIGEKTVSLNKDKLTIGDSQPDTSK